MQRILAVVAAVVLTGLFAAPASADDAADCAYVTQIVAENNRDAPYMADTVTRSEMASHDCVAKVVSFNWTITINTADLAPDWQQVVRANFEAGVCGEQRIADIVKSGWRLMATWVTADNARFATEVVCS
jgi:hypothetical protein